MTESPQITLEQALELVSFEFTCGRFVVEDVHDSVHGNVGGNVLGNVGGNVSGDVGGSVWGNVGGYVCGTINHREWQFIETPAEKLKRLIESNAPKDQLLQALTELND